MNIKNSILLASMTLALCACPLSDGDDVASKIHHPDDHRLIGPQEPDAIDDLTKELAKNKKTQLQEVSAKVQEAQAKIFADAAKDGKPDTIAAALMKFDSAGEPRKSMTNTPELLEQYAKLQAQCLAMEECKTIYQPDDGKPGGDDDDTNKPDDEKPEGEGKNVPKAENRTPKKPMMDPTELVNKVASLPLTPAEQAALMAKLSTGDFTAVPDDMVDNVLPKGEEIIVAVGPEAKHIYRTDKVVFLSQPGEGNRVLRLEKAFVKDADNEAQKAAEALPMGTPPFAMVYNGEVRTWGAVPSKEPGNPLVPHLLSGKLQYRIEFSTGVIEGSGTITDLPYAGNVANAQGGMSVATQDGKFQLGPVTFTHKAPTGVFEKLTGDDPTYVSDAGKVTWIQKDGSFLPIGSAGSYEMVLHGDKAQFLVGRATVDQSDILMSGEGQKEP